VEARVGAEGTLIKIVAQAVGATNVAQGAVAGRQGSGGIDGVVNAVTRRHALLVGLEVAKSAAVNNGANRTAVSSRAVALSDEATVGLSNVVASGSGVNTVARVGKAGRGDFAGGTL
jgi:outer membrane cobalamin receptor